MECFLVAEANVSKPFWMFGAHSLKINKQTKMSRKKTTENTYMHDITSSKVYVQTTNVTCICMQYMKTKCCKILFDIISGFNDNEQCIYQYV